MTASPSGNNFRLSLLAKVAALLSAAFLFTPVFASTTVVPNSAAGAEGNSSFYFFGSSARTYQIQIAASHLTDLGIGSQITGLSFRLNGGAATTPTSNLSVSDFEITLAQATNAITSFSTTVADNMTDPVMVRDGAYTFASGSYRGGATPIDGARSSRSRPLTATREETW